MDVHPSCSKDAVASCNSFSMIDQKQIQYRI